MERGDLMGSIHQQLMRALIAAQVGVLEHADGDVGDQDGCLKAIEALEQCSREIAKLVKKLRKSEGL